MSHTAYSILIAGLPRLFVKRGDPIRSQGRDLGCEAAVYRLVETHPELKEILPACLHVGAADQLVVLEALAADPLLGFTSSVMEAYGHALAIAHGVPFGRHGQAPWLLTCLEQAIGPAGWLSPRSTAFLTQLQSEEVLRRSFRQGWAEWRTGTLVHGDLRTTNALLDRTGTRIWLVDWELACSGDAAWDLGSLLADVLATLALEHHRVEVGEESMALFHTALRSYRLVHPSPPPEWAGLLERSVRLAGIRLVQTVLEMGLFSEESMEQGLTLLLPWIRHLLHHTKPVAACVLAACPP
ncbi:MAG: phosphotransferase family protein [Cyanobium sp.]